jgi:uncharacterized protein YerC
VPSSSQKSKLVLDPQQHKALCTLLADLHRQSEVAEVLDCLLSPREVIAASKKLAALCAFHEQKTYAEIQKEVDLSSATLAQLSEQKFSAGAVRAVEKVREESWASEVVKKLKFWK